MLAGVAMIPAEIRQKIPTPLHPFAYLQREVGFPCDQREEMSSNTIVMLLFSDNVSRGTGKAAVHV
jgi:hypothetical protein